jgi:hypothetical protein
MKNSRVALSVWRWCGRVQAWLKNRQFIDDHNWERPSK